MRYKDQNFNFIRDIHGNISKIMHRNKLVAEYNYTAWGSCSVTKHNISNVDDFVVDNNPFRWKGYYCDLETSLESRPPKIKPKRTIMFMDSR